MLRQDEIMPRHKRSIGERVSLTPTASFLPSNSAMPPTQSERGLNVNNWFAILGPTEFPAAWEEILRQRVPIDRLLPEPDRRELRSYIRWFIGSKEFEGCGGLAITDEIRVTVAAHACLLLL